jgi:hypothetical protein
MLRKTGRRLMHARRQPLLSSRILAGDEHVPAREFREHLRRLTEIWWRARPADLPRSIARDGLVDSGIESDQDALRSAADILDRVAVALRDAADIALLQSLDPVAAADPPA